MKIHRWPDRRKCMSGDVFHWMHPVESSSGNETEKKVVFVSSVLAALGWKDFDVT